MPANLFTAEAKARVIIVRIHSCLLQSCTQQSCNALKDHLGLDRHLCSQSVETYNMIRPWICLAGLALVAGYRGMQLAVSGAGLPTDTSSRMQQSTSRIPIRCGKYVVGCMVERMRISMVSIAVALWLCLLLSLRSTRFIRANSSRCSPSAVTFDSRSVGQVALVIYEWSDVAFLGAETPDEVVSFLTTSVFPRRGLTTG